MSISRFAGRYNANDYAYGVQGGPPALQVYQGNSVTGSAQTLTLAFGQTTAADGTVFNPPATTTPMSFGTGSNAETLTPSAVSNPTPAVYGSCTVTVTPSNVHGIGDAVTSGTFGLQEAINAASAVGGGIVVVDAKWFSAGGTQTIIDAATLPSTVTVEYTSADDPGSVIHYVNIPATLTQLQTLHSVGILLAPAAGAGTLNELISCVVDVIYGSAAFTGGGAVTVNYGLGGTSASTSNIAATIFTSLSANEIATLVGPPTSIASSAALNKSLVLQAASADFAVGTGASGQIRAAYRVHTGLS